MPGIQRGSAESVVMKLAFFYKSEACRFVSDPTICQVKTLYPSWKLWVGWSGTRLGVPAGFGFAGHKLGIGFFEVLLVVAISQNDSRLAPSLTHFRIKTENRHRILGNAAFPPPPLPLPPPQTKKQA